ncbi:MAG: hypothetical protein COX40_05695 [Candidatus Omnitrophica bacterium CG23_combo_of_CG06-09_8_20_14_all_40_11]|nr:MAG: hypothetical protein COX40_05695 [Candidatus Omnitrophica bacterium CG23_combo_of_CG06-09_8_20_14_all_40_11]
MKKIIFLIMLLFISISITGPVFAERDWEYWSRYSFEAPLSKQISYLIKPEWRFKKDMGSQYLFKLEQAIAFKVNKFLELAPYYVWQENKTSAGYDKSDLFYLDVTGKMPLKEFFDLKIIDRLRYQYNFDKALTFWRNSMRLTKAFKVGKIELSPFIEDETFYDTKQDKFNENWASAGISLALNKHLNIGVSYLLDTKKKGDDWSYANVLVTSMSLKF